MPAHRLGTTPHYVRRYDVAGQDSQTVPNFVRHVALCPDEVPDYRPNDEVSFTDMAPPLRVGVGHQTMTVLGTVPLTEDEVRQIETFIVEIQPEFAAQQRRGQYIVSPHADPPRAGDGTVVFRKFSCAGLVIEAYREVDIDLMVTDEAQLPPVTLETLLLAYPDQERELRSPARRRVGLGDAGPPWPVVLAGYVLNALARPEVEIRAGPYQPQPGDEFFPPRRDSSAP